MTTINKSLDNSRQFDFHLWTESKAIESILREIIPSIDKGETKARSKNLRAIVTNVVAAYLMDPEKWIAYRRSPNAYAAIPARYNVQAIGYEPLKAVTDCLVKAEWCEQDLGGKSHNPKNRKASRIRATEKLAELIRRSGLSIADFCRHPEEEVIVLRDSKTSPDRMGRNIDYIDTTLIVDARKRLREYNTMMLRHHVEIPSSVCEEVDSLYISVRRIFANGSFNEGGRFYGGWWQGLNGGQRKTILLDGSPVVELDYRAVHLYLAYREKGVVYKGDPYDLSSLPKDARPIAKTVLLVLFNCKKKATKEQGKRAVISAVRKQLQKSISEGNDDNLRTESRFSNVKNIDLYLNGRLLGDIVDEMLEKHSAVADQFFSGNGTKFQRQDSDLVDYVLREFVALDKPILPIHDSFVVKQEDELLLRNTMEDACIKVLSFEPCEIKYALAWI